MTPPHDSLVKGLRAWDRGDTWEAIRCLRRTLRSAPDLVDAWILLADVEQHQELFGPAVRSYRRALDLLTTGRGRRFPCIPPGHEPTEAGIHRGLGACLGATGDLAGAEAAFRQAVALEPSAASHVALGEVLELQGRRREALASFRAGLAEEPGHVELLYRLGCWHLWTHPRRAEHFLRETLRREPRHDLARCAVGLLLGSRHAWREAEEHLRVAERSGKVGALPHVYRGHNLWHQGDLVGAEASYRKAMAVAPDDPHPHHALGDLFRHLGRPDEARRAYEQALALDPRCGDALLRLGHLLDEAGQNGEAARHFRRGLDLAPQHPWAYEVRRRLQELGEGPATDDPPASGSSTPGSTTPGSSASGAPGGGPPGAEPRAPS